MATQIKVGKLPKWLRQALKAKVLNYREADVLHKLAYLVDYPETVDAPPFLEAQMQALYLLEMPAHRA